MVKKLDKNAVSQVISTVLVVMIVVSAISAILYWGIPYIQERERKTQVQTLLSNYDHLDSTINELILQGAGTKSVSTISNMNELGSLDINSKSDKMILFYSYNNSFDFNVSGLDDGDNNFSIEMSPGSPTLDYIRIFNLSLENEASFSPSLDTGHKKIYNGVYYAQAFEPPEDWNLTKIKLYLSCYGRPTDDLNISICAESSSVPNIESPLVSATISKNVVSGSSEWIECDFEEVQLSSSNRYYIVLNTTSGTDSSNYYRWNRDLIYNQDSLETYNATEESSPIVWSEMLNYFFMYRLYYTDNSSPYIENVFAYVDDQFAQLDSFVFRSGVPYDFYIRPLDDDGGDVDFYVLWGDGSHSKTESSLQGGQPIFFSHLWQKSGQYKIIFSVLDNHSIFNEEDYTKDIYVDYWNDYPSDLVGTPERINVVDPIDISAIFELEGCLRIDLFNNTVREIFTNNVVNETVGFTPFGRIWVFDLGFLRYNSPYEIGNSDIVYQNGAVISIEDGIGEFKKEPTFFSNELSNGENIFAIRIIKINSDENYSGGAGLGSYKLGLSTGGSFSREPIYELSDNLKIQFFGDNEDIWLDYFEDNYNFTRLINSDDPFISNTIFYEKNRNYMIFDTSVVEVSVKGVQ